MRVTSNSFPNSLLNQLGTLASRQARLQNQAATGQRIQNPEDDPRAMRHVLEMQSESRSLDQYQRNITRLAETASATYTAMRSLKTVNERASEIAVLSDDLRSPEERAIYAQEINQLLEQAVQTANTRHRGDYLFAGTKVDQPPFVVEKDANGNIISVRFQGNSEAIEAEVAPDVLASGHAVGANTGTTGPRGLITDARSGADLFAHLISLRDNLVAGNTDAIANTDAANLQRDEENFLYHFGHNGAVQARLEAATSLASDQAFALEQQVSAEVDADLAQTLVRLNEVQTAYTAALQTGGKILSSSLLDYLR